MPAIEGYVFCHCLPIDEPAFFAGKTDPETDFIRHYTTMRSLYNRPADWVNYKQELVDPYLKLRNGFCKFGVKFIENCTWNNYKGVINDPQYKVVILFSHCINNGKPEECIQFAGGMVSSDTLVNAIPDGIIRTYDFSVCRSIYLKQLFQTRKRKNICGTSEKFIPVSIWLYIFSKIFEELVLEQSSYEIALNKTFEKILLEQKKRKNEK